MTCHQEGVGGSGQGGGPFYWALRSSSVGEPSRPQWPLRKLLLAFSPRHLGVVVMRHLWHSPRSESPSSSVPEASHVPPVPSPALTYTPATAARIRYPPPHPCSGCDKTTQQSTLLLFFQNEKCALSVSVSEDLIRGGFKNRWLERLKVAE